jgi:hypothetical protein
MLESLHLTNVGPAPTMQLELAPRLNLLTGDNGLGKSFLLDVAWWALTRTWSGTIALPTTSKPATIEYVVRGKGDAERVTSRFRREDERWPLDAKRPPIPGIVVYIRIDGGFSVWDPARNYWRRDPERAPAYHFTAAEVWDGLTLDRALVPGGSDIAPQLSIPHLAYGDRRVCEGLERDWVSWQEGRKPQFKALEEVLRVLSPTGEPLRAGRPRRLFLGEGRDRPTLLIGNQEVPIALLSAGMRRVLALAYFLVWTWYEHQVAAQLLGRKPEDRFVILFDEPESHLHPRWQRTIVPSVIAAIEALRDTHALVPQLLVATHSPLVLASVEPLFSPERDELFHLNVIDGEVVLERGGWAIQGDVSDWLLSDVFGLEHARSVEAERAIEAAEAFMRGERKLPRGLQTRKAIHEELQRLLPANDRFWPRWLIDGKAMALVKPKKKSMKKRARRA